MEILPRIMLFGIIKKHGLSILEDPKELEKLLNEYCFDFKREVSALTDAVKSNIAADLMVFGEKSQIRVLIDVLSKRLMVKTGLSEEDARWAVLSWALALEKINEKELNTLEDEIIERKNKNPMIREAKDDEFSLLNNIIVVYLAAAAIIAIAVASLVYILSM